MPLSWTISHQDKLVHAIATGVFSTAEIQSYLGSVIAEQAMPYAKLFDMSEATSLVDVARLGEVADTVRLYDKMKLGPIGPLAIVISDLPSQRTYAELFLRSATAKRPVQVFDTIGKARTWLGAT
jgi:hypothetical protein